VVLVFAALIIAVTVIIEPNEYRPYIVRAVESNTGRSFEVQGDLGLNVLPCCSVSMGASRLGNPEGFPDDEFASFDKAALSLKLWPLLLRREVQIGTVTVDGLAVSLVSLADGRVNWEFESATEAAPEAEDGDTALAELSVDGLALRNGSIRYQDFATDQDVTVDEIRLDSRIAMAGERLTISAPALAATLRHADLPGGQAGVRVAADSLTALLADEMELSIDGLDAELRAAESRLRLRGGGSAGSAMAMTGEFTLDETSPRRLLAALGDDAFEPADRTALTRLAATGTWTLGASSLNVDNIDITLDDSRLTGSLAVDDFDTLASRFDLALDRIDVDRYAAAETAASPSAAAVEPTSIPLDALAGLNITGALSITALQAANVNVAGLRLELASQDGTATMTLGGRIAEGSFALDGRGNVGGSSPQLTGTIDVRDVSPRALLTAMDADLATADPAVLARFAGTSRWRLTPASLALTDMRWQLDDSSLTGTLQVDDFDTLASRFDLTLDRMNVDAYLAPDDADAAPAEDVAEIPVEAIRDLNLDGRLRAQELTVANLTLRNVTATVSAADGILRLDPLTAGLYGGEYRGNVVIDATGPTANLTLDQELAAVQVSEILQSFFGSDVLAGSMSMKLTGSGAGNTFNDLLRGVAGNLSLNLSDGVYRGTNVLYELQRARALFRNEPAPQAPASNVTSIRALAMSGTMRDGVLQTNQFDAETSALRLLGQGGINLMDLALDYQLTAQVIEAAAGAAGLSDLRNTRIPLTLRGPLLSPSVGVDFKGLVTGAVRDTVEQRARDLLRDRLGGAKPEAPGEGAEAPAEQPEDAPETREPSSRDVLEQGLRGLLQRQRDRTPPAEEPQ
jgi:AsmA protein